MATISVTIDKAEVEKWLGKLPANIESAIARIIQKVSYMIERQAKINAPVDTGRLRSSISTALIPMRATIEPHVFYAVYVHNGTRFIKARPFLTDAYNEVFGDIDNIAQQEIGSALK